MSGKKFTAEERIQAARICAEGKMSASKMSKKLGVRKSLVIERGVLSTAFPELMRITFTY